jgi:predicted GTPase
MTRTIEISFENASISDSGRFAQELEDVIRRSQEDIVVTRRKSDSGTQDIGTIVSVVITSGATLALAKGIADWIRLRKSSLTIKANGEVIATGLSGEQTVRLAELLKPH